MIRNIKALGLSLVAVFAMSAMTASAASANPAEFVASAYPAHIIAKGIGTQSFNVNGTNLTCVESEGAPSVELTAQEEVGPSSSVKFFTPTEKTGTEVWSNCHATVLKIPVTVHQNGCKFEFTAGNLVSNTEGTTAESGNTATGSVNIVGCENGATHGITITIGNEGKTCHIDVPEQNAIGGSVHYATETTEDEREDIVATVKNIEIKVDTTGGSACAGSTEEPEPPTHIAVFNGESRVTATGEEQSVTIE